MVHLFISVSDSRNLLGFADPPLIVSGAGDEARTRNFQLGKLNFRSFIFNTYKIAQRNCACMRCLICVSLGEFSGDRVALWHRCSPGDGFMKSRSNMLTSYGELALLLAITVPSLSKDMT